MANADAEPAEGQTSNSGPSISEVWTVQARHAGCYTGGKVAWSESVQLLCCLASEELHLVDVSTQLPTRQVSEEGDGILTFAIDPSGQNVCTSHRSGLLRHYSLEQQPALLARSWRAHEELVSDVCFDVTGAFLASGSVDHTAKVWDFAGYFCTHNFRGHEDIVSIVRFHPSRLHLLTVAGNELRLWDLQTSKCLVKMKDHLAAVSSLSFSPALSGGQSDYQLVSGGRDNVVNVWTLKDGQAKSPLARTIPAFESVEGVVVVPLSGLREACSPDGQAAETQFHRWVRTTAKLPAYVIFTGGDKALLRAWNPSSGACVAEEPSPHGAKGLLRQILCLGPRRLLSIGDDLNLVIWSLPQLRVESYIMGHNDDIVHVQLIPELTWPAGPKAAPSLAASRFVCITNDELPRVVDCQGFGAKMLRGHSDMVIACDVSADGQWIATGGKDQRVRIWSAETAKCVCKLHGHEGPVSALSFPKKKPKSQSHGADQPFDLVSASQDKIMKVWQLPPPNKLREHASDASAQEIEIRKAKSVVVAHTKEVNDVVVSPNNKLIASAGQDKLVRIWKFPEADLLGECTGHRRGIWCVAFSPTDQVIATASADGTVRLWNLKDYSAIRSFQGHGGAVLRVCFLSNGMQLMTSSSDGLLKLWQIRTADCAATYEEHTGKVWCIDVIGQQMVSCGSDSKLCVWRDVTAEQAKERQDAEADAAMKDTRIGLLVREGKVEAALTMALDLNRPGQMRQILVDHTMEVVEKCLDSDGQGVTSASGGTDRGTGAGTGSQKEDNGQGQGKGDLDVRLDVDLQRWIHSLSPSQLERLVEMLEQWNSNRRMASIAQMLMGLVLHAVPPSQLGSLEGMNATCGNILGYSSRHMARVDALLQKTFLFDLVLQSGSLGLALDGPGSVGVGVGMGAGVGVDGAHNGEEKSKSMPHDPAGALERTMAVLLGRQEDGEDDEKVAVDRGSDNDDDASEGEDEDDAALAAPGALKAAVAEVAVALEQKATPTSSKRGKKRQATGQAVQDHDQTPAEPQRQKEEAQAVAAAAAGKLKANGKKRRR